MLFQRTNLDLFDAGCEQNRQLEKLPLPKLPGAYTRRSQVDEPSVSELKSVFDAVRSVIAAIGLPKNTVIQWATLDDVGAGAAGFRDAPRSWLQPFMLLDKSIVAQAPSSLAHQVLIGVSLHESAHLLWSRECYRAMAQNRRLPSLRLALNLCEDHRIENLMLEAAPGFASYLGCARRQILDLGQVGRSLREDWATLPDLDRVVTLIFGVLRLPHRVTAEAKAWRAVNGECIFTTLRRLLPEPPTSEIAAIRQARRIHRLLCRLRKHYPQTESELQKALLAADDDEAQRLQRQWEADRQDDVDAATGVTATRPGRFGMTDALRAVESAIGDGLSSTELDAVTEAFSRAATDAMAGISAGCQSSNVVVREVTTATLDNIRRYDEALGEVRPHVLALRSLLSQQFQTRKATCHGLRRGKLDPRRIALARATDRVFRQEIELPSRRLALAILLDESGSMCGSKEAAALRVGVMSAEAARGVPGLELQVYSHTSPNFAEACLIREYAVDGRGYHSLGDYCREANQNYDFLAIDYVAERLRNTVAERRVLLSISDGFPCDAADGRPGIEVTREAVCNARRSGVQVIGIAIDNFDAHKIYGPAWTLSCTDLTTLTMGIRRLWTRLFQAP